MHACCCFNDIAMMITYIIVIRILPPPVEMYKVFEPHFGITFDSFKVRVIVRFALNLMIRVIDQQ
jgi:hypothetical protein